MKGCQCSTGCRSGASWLPFTGTFIHDKTAGRFQIRFFECSVCHAVEASVVDRGVWDKIEFSMEHRWGPVMIDTHNPYLFPNPVPRTARGLAAIYRWVSFDHFLGDRSELHLGETDDLYSDMLRLVRSSNRSPLRLLLDSCVARGLKVGIEQLGISPFRLNSILMSSVAIRDRAVRQFMLAAIRAESALRKRR
jgi:hypothetical protein